MQKVILLIEDDAAQRRLMERVLSTSGYSVTSAVDGETGVELAGTLSPRLIVLDVMLPGINGYQACRSLKQAPKTSGIPILMLTTKQDPADELWASQVGADAFLTKPVEIPSLLAEIARLAGPA